MAPQSLQLLIIEAYLFIILDAHYGSRVITGQHVPLGLRQWAQSLSGALLVTVAEGNDYLVKHTGTNETSAGNQHTCVHP